MTTELGEFEGAEVLRTAITITNAGDGLSEALKTEPRIIHRGDKGYLVLEWECTEVRFSPADKDDPHGDAVRVHKLKAGTATFVDHDLVGHLIDEQREKNLQAREDAAGIRRLEFGPNGEDLDDDDEDPQEGEVLDAAPALTGLTKAALRDLCDRHGIIYAAKATGNELVDLLRFVPGIEVLTPTDPDSVTSLRPGGTDG